MVKWKTGETDCVLRKSERGHFSDFLILPKRGYFLMLTNWGKGHEADKFCESFSVDREKMVPQKYITPLKRETGEGREFGRKKSFLSNPQFDPRNLEPKIGLKKKRRMNSQGKHSMGRIDANLGDFSSALK